MSISPGFFSCVRLASWLVSGVWNSSSRRKTHPSVSHCYVTTHGRFENAALNNDMEKPFPLETRHHIFTVTFSLKLRVAFLLDDARISPAFKLWGTDRHGAKSRSPMKSCSARRSTKAGRVRVLACSPGPFGFLHVNLIMEGSRRETNWWGRWKKRGVFSYYVGGGEYKPCSLVTMTTVTSLMEGYLLRWSIYERWLGEGKKF